MPCGVLDGGAFADKFLDRGPWAQLAGCGCDMWAGQVKVSLVNITVSIVSHGHGAAVRSVLEQLAARHEPCLRRVIVTFNVGDARHQAGLLGATWPFELIMLNNPAPLGFGANHNQAFAVDGRQGGSELFAVLNPDVRLRDNPWGRLVAALEHAPAAGLVYPRQVDAQGRQQDHERLVPTPGRLLRRYLLRRTHELAFGQQPDWVNAAFLVLRRSTYEQIGGFDERFHMYGEDVDLCLRLQLAGWGLLRVPAVVIEHAGQRASRRLGRHMGWHVRSLWRLWRSDAWRSWHLRPTPGRK